MTIQELEQCILLYGKDIYSFCMHLAKEKESADDLYQDAFLEATKKIASIRYEDNPKSYLLSIVIRLWKNRVRKRAWRDQLLHKWQRKPWKRVRLFPKVMWWNGL
ncbi:MAG: RNA polymerase sigma factor [Agathobacter sp.]